MTRGNDGQSEISNFRSQITEGRVMEFNGREVTGQNNPQSKLTDLERQCICEAHGQIGAVSLAKVYGVSESTVRTLWTRAKKARVKA